MGKNTNLLSPIHKLYFLHVPKTGGSSIRKFYKKRGNTTHRKVVPEKYPDYFVFMFVRDPWNRLYSAFKYSVMMGRSQNWNRLGRERFKKYQNDFERFVLEFLNEEEINSFVHFNEQIQWYDDKVVDFVGRFENLVDDLDKMFKMNNMDVDVSEFPHRNKTGSGDYKHHYTDEMKEKVSDIYSCDIKMFNYTF